MARVNGALPSSTASRAASVFADGRLRLIVYAWLPILGLILAWEAVSRAGLVTPFALPAFSSAVVHIFEEAESGDLVLNLGTTLYRTFAGFAIAGVLGIVIGVGIARHWLTRWFFDPLISVGFPLPKIAFIPVIVLWFGFFDTSKIIIVAFSTIFPVVTTTVIAVQGVEKELVWSARGLGTSERAMLWDVILPAALPLVLTGLQVALPIALIVCIITEMSMSGYGLGGAMQTAARFADSRGVFGGIIETTIVGYLLVKGMALLRRRLLVWHQEAVGPSTV
jgi:ABC-type nitrate/sulfonate/bicarbonate transport system permease component